MQNRQCHDLAHAITWEIFKLVRDQIPADLQRDTFDEFYAICRNQIDIYEYAKAQQEARLRPLRPHDGG